MQVNINSMKLNNNQSSPNIFICINKENTFCQKESFG